MKKVDIVSELYVPLLAALHIEPDESGVLHRNHRDSVKVCEVNKRKMVLPTSENLKSLPLEDYVYFHPLSENIARGDSPIYNYLKLALTLRVNYTIIGLANLLLEVANDKTLDGKLKSHQLGLLEALPKVDNKTVSHFSQAYANTDLDKKVFFSVYNKRNGKINGTSFNRVAVVRFPLMEQLNNPTESEFWTSIKGIRKADYANYLSLFNFILPGWDVENQYSGSSDSMEAPSFHALVMAFLNVMKRLNKVMADFSDVCDVTDLIATNLDVVESAMGNLARYVNLIAPLEGNTGEMAANDGQVNQLQNRPIGIPPAGLMNAAESKFNSVGHQQQPQPAPAPVQPAYGQQPQQPAVQQPQQPSGFIGFGPGTLSQPQAPVYGGYPQQPQSPYGYAQQPQQPPVGGYIGYPGQYQQPTPPPVSNDPVAQWNAAVGQMQQPQYPQQGMYPQQGYGAAPYQQPAPQQYGAPVAPQYPAQQPYGYPQQMPQGYPQQPQQPYGGYPQQPQQPQRPVFRKQGEAAPQAPQPLAPAFGQPAAQNQPPKFRTM